mmetsp:Transcript_6202/g.14266  ORF Transcript_6202/g.14266 Transcript_6202/m.14266 type:complete len:272 (+) Transcript_6202:292-1107(+)
MHSSSSMGGDSWGDSDSGEEEDDDMIEGDDARGLLPQFSATNLGDTLASPSAVLAAAGAGSVASARDPASETASEGSPKPGPQTFGIASMSTLTRDSGPILPPISPVPAAWSARATQAASSFSPPEAEPEPEPEPGAEASAELPTAEEVEGQLALRRVKRERRRARLRAEAAAADAAEALAELKALLPEAARLSRLALAQGRQEELKAEEERLAIEAAELAEQKRIFEAQWWTNRAALMRKDQDARSGEEALVLWKHGGADRRLWKRGVNS